MELSAPAGTRPGGRYASWAPSVPRYVVADVDGTLIASGTTATPVVADAVTVAHAAGLRVGFATGRLPVGLSDLHGQLGPSGPHIVHNGAQVRFQGRPLRTWPIDPAAAVRLAELCRRERLYAEFFVGEGFWVSEHRDAMLPHWEHVTGEPAGMIADLDLGATEVIKASVVPFDGDELARCLPAVTELGLNTDTATSPLMPGITFVNVTALEADKGRGVTFAAEHVGCGLDEVVAVGDGMNDLTMLCVVGTAIAMGQAPPAVHEVAHLVVPEAQDDGVAHALLAAAQWRAEALGD